MSGPEQVARTPPSTTHGRKKVLVETLNNVAHHYIIRTQLRGDQHVVGFAILFNVSTRMF